MTARVVDGCLLNAATAPIAQFARQTYAVFNAQISQIKFYAPWFWGWVSAEKQARHDLVTIACYDESMSDSSTPTEPIKQPNRTFILRVVPDHAANNASYVVKVLPDNSSQIFRTLSEALRHIQTIAQ